MKPRTYWQENLRLVAGCLAVWFVVSFGFGIVLVDVLNRIPLGGFRLGFWFAQQGSIYVFLVLIFFYAWRMGRLDRKHGVDEGSPQPGSARGNPSQERSPQPGSARGNPSQGRSPQPGSARGNPSQERSPQPGSARGNPSQGRSPQPGSARGNPSQERSPQPGSARGEPLEDD